MSIPAVALCILFVYSGAAFAETHDRPGGAPIRRAPTAPEAGRARELAKLFSHLGATGPRGCGVGIRLNGREVFRGGFGNSGVGGRPVDADTRFYLASVSKPIVALAILKLHEETRGGILDKTISQLVPALRDRRFSRITVRDVLRHRAGFVRDTEELASELRPLPGRRGRAVLHLGGVRTEGGRPPEPDLTDPATDSRLPAILRRLDERGRANALFKHPIGRYHYSNLGFELLAGIIQSLTRETPTRYLETKLFGPAGMTRTTLSDPRDAVGGRDFARGVSASGRVVPFDKWAGLLGSGGVLSSAGDMSKLAELLDAVDDGRRQTVLRRDSLRQAFAGLKDPGDEGKIGYGLGWSTSPPDQSRPTARGYQWHSGSAYGYQTYFERLQRRGCNLSLAVLCNHPHPTPWWKLSEKIQGIYCP